jgi:hypothetical protein
MKKRIVAEISRNWIGCNNDPAEKPLLSHTFEGVIERNGKRGYALESWQLHQLFCQVDGKPGIVETIIAVFVEDK